MSGNPMEKKEEVSVGRRVFVSDGRLAFVGEKVRFRGESLGGYTADDSIDEDRLTRTLTQYVLYRCPNGYRIYRSELYYRRRKERSRWQRKEAYSTLLPTLDEEQVGQNEESSSYGLYTEKEARQKFPELFSALGMPNVRELD